MECKHLTLEWRKWLRLRLKCIKISCFLDLETVSRYFNICILNIINNVYAMRNNKASVS